MPSLAELFAAASSHYQSGSRGLAIDCLRTALQIKPGIPEAHNNLGIVLAEEGRLAEAVASFQEAVRLKPNYADAHNNLGNALRQQGRLDEAADHFHQAIRLRPDYAEAHCNLGIVLLGQDKCALAEASLRQAVRLKPGYVEAHINLGAVLEKLDRPAEVEASLRQVVRVNPGHADAHLNLGVALAQQGKLDEAVASFRQAQRLSPDSALALCNLGNALREQGQHEDALLSLHEALHLQPEYAEAHNNFGLVLQVQGKLDQAVESYQRAVRFKPEFAEAHQNLGNVLKDLSRLDEAIAAFRTALRLKPNHRLHSSLLWVLKLHPDVDAKAIYEESRRWDEVYAAPLKGHHRPHANQPDPHRRLRIGYVSPDFSEHSCSFFTIPLLANHDHQQFEICCYADVKKPDSFTKQLRAYADVWRDIAGRSDDEVAHVIRADQIDVLVDLAMHTSNNRLLLFARKPAPVQVCWLAYPGTTGLSTMDYRLTDPYMDPPGLLDAYYSEQSLRLPDTFWCYDPLTDQPPVNPLPALASGVVTFGCLNNFDKVNDAVLGLWARVLRAVPQSRLLLLVPAGQARKRVVACLGQEGVAAERIEFADRRPKPEYLKLYQRMDIALDPFPCNGGTTTLDASWMGVPTVTLVGRTVVGRSGLSLLCNLELKELAAETPDEYVAIAARLAADLPRLQELRGSMRQRMLRSRLMDGKHFARHMEDAYRVMWRGWCKHRGRVVASRPAASAPDGAEPHFNEGNALMTQGKAAEAEASYRQALRLRPDFADACNNLGVALWKQGKYAEAEASYRQALRFRPDFADAYNNLGSAQGKLGKSAEALASLQQALRLKPDYAEAHLNLGNAFQEQGMLQEATASYQQAIRHKSDYAVAYNNLGTVLQKQGSLDEAEANYQEAIRVQPDYADAYQNLGNVINKLGGFDTALAAWRKALQLKPGAADIHSCIIFHLHYYPGYDAAAIYEECKRWNHQHAEPLKRLIQPHGNTAAPERRLRIGYISPDFRDHVVSFFVVPLLAHHDRGQCELYCYSDVASPDTVTDRLRSYTDRWRNTAGLPDQQLTDMIRADQIDILVDLAMHTSNNRLLVFARKPAPIQVAWLAYPGTTGLEMMDYRLTDPHFDPPGLFDAYYSEESVRLPDTFWCFDPLTDQPRVNSLPALETGVITFGCLNNFRKVNEDVLTLWAQMLRAVPQSRLLLLAPPGRIRERVRVIFQQAGVAESRVEFADRKLIKPDYMKLYHRVDIGLDPFPCNGGATTLDAFWMGVPTITLVGKTVVGRAGWSVLCNLGLKELAAETPEQYIALAAQLAADLPRLQDLRGTLRQRMEQSPLMDAKRFVRHLEDAYRVMWRKWCEQRVENHSVTTIAIDAPSASNASELSKAEAHFREGLAVAQQGRYDDAVTHFQEALRLNPEKAAGAHNNLGNVFMLQGKKPEAVASYRHAVACNPEFAAAHNNLGNALREQGQLQEARVSLQRALELRPDFAEAHSGLILTMHYLPGCDAGALYEECRRWNERHAEPLKGQTLAHANRADPERRLRIGYVSPVFRDHVSCFFTLPLLSNHDHRRFEVYCYADVTRPDAMTERHRDHADVWRSTSGLSDQQVADLVRSDQIDILVDLAMHTANNRLLVFAREPAPVQVCWLAYPGTTGLSSMDYRLTDPYLDPPGLFDASYSEESIRLADTFWCYDPLTEHPSVNSPPAKENGLITFGCLNHFCKINDDCLALWARVLQAVPQSRMLLLAPQGEARERVLARLSEADIAPSRIQFTQTLPRQEYLRLYHQIDLCLDPAPCNGHTTSLDAFWMGVPTITLVSKQSAFGRAGWSQLCNLQLQDLAAETPEEYVMVAARLAGDLPRLEELRSTLRQRMQQSPLMDAKRFAWNMEAAYRQLWRTWCRQNTATETDGPKSLATLTELLAAAAQHNQAGRHQLAIDCLREVLRIRPESPEVHNNLGVTLAQQGHLADAVVAFQMAARLKPDYAEAHNNLGNALREQGQLQPAVASLEEALRLQPHYPEANTNLGIALQAQGKLDEALASYRRALRSRPDFALAHLNLGNVFKELGRMDEAVAAYRAGLAIRPDAAFLHSNLILALHYHPASDARAIYEECRRWSLQHAEPLKRFVRPHGNTPDPEQRLRIGYVSPHFGHHAISFATVPLLSSHDHQAFDIFCYSDVLAPDDLTERLRGCADVWRNTAGLSDEQVADMVRGDQIDILVDLAMHTANSRLRMFARKPAPVQVAWTAYPGTTGLSTIDYRLTDPYLDPPGLFDASYAEESLRLPDSFWCYDPLTEQPAVNDLPALTNGVITFGCLNSFCKINDGCLELWAQVLLASPQSRLLLLAPAGQTRDRVLARLRQEGIAATRVEFADRQRRLEYLQLYQRIDVSLDPLPYNGHTTSLDAFWMGVPSVTMVSQQTAFGRAGWSQLNNLGLQALAAQTPEEYVTIAARLAGDLPRLQELRSTLRQRMERSPLMDAKRFARNMEEAYRLMWRRWCQQAGAAGLGACASTGSGAGATGQSSVNCSDRSAPVPISSQASSVLVSMDQAISEGGDPAGSAEAHNSLGLTLAQQGLLEPAIDHFHNAVRRKPEFADAYFNLGRALGPLGKLDEAVASFQQALRLKPDFAGAHNGLGAALMQQGKVDEAVLSFQQALRLKPDFAEGHSNLGAALGEQGKLEDASACFEAALRLKPDLADAYSNLGRVLARQGKLDEAVASFQQALRLKADFAEAHNNLGAALAEQGNLEGAISCLDQALALKPDYVDAHITRASLRLLSGDFERGWPEYQWRLRGRGRQPQSFAQPRWDGAPLAGKTILLHAEQGLGDSLQFIRYAPLVKAKGGPVLVECPEPLLQILASCPGIDRLVAQGLPWQEAFDVQAPLLDLPGIFRTSLATIPAQVPYLFADASQVERWRQEVGLDNAFKIGITWQGNPKHHRDRQRSMPLSHFTRLAQLPGVRLFSLQKGTGAEQLDTFAAACGVCDLGRSLNTFMDTAAVLMSLDLVVTADTAVAHLAGALGVPVWLALPFAPDWRWLLDRNDSPWYPSMRLFRQRQPGEWQGVFDDMAAEIAALLAANPEPRPVRIRIPPPGKRHTMGSPSPEGSPSIARGPRPVTTLMELLGAAGQHYQAGRRDSAIDCLRQAIYLRYDIPEAHNNLGATLAQEGRLAEAVASFQMAVCLKPDYAEAHNNLGKALKEQGRLDEAFDSLQEALRLRPAYTEAHENLASILAQDARLPTALLRFLPPDAGVVLEIGCGCGTMAARYKEVNPRGLYLGVEADAEAAARASTCIDRVVTGDIETGADAELGLAPESVDCLVFSRGIQALADPGQTPRRLAGYLKPGGQVLASVPVVRHGKMGLNAIQELFRQAGLRIFDIQPPCVADAELDQFREPLAMELSSAEFPARVGAVQYAVRAVKEPAIVDRLLVQTAIGCAFACGPVRVVDPERFLATIPGVKTCSTTGHYDLAVGDRERDKVFVWQRGSLVGRAGVERQRELLRRGYLIVYEVDDDPRLERFDMSANDFFALRSCHCLQTTTEPLAGLLRQFNPHVRVFENQLRALPSPRRYAAGDEAIVFFGALHREKDWEPLLPALVRVLNTHAARVRFRVVGDRRFFDALPTDRKEFTPPCSYEQYLDALGSCDIGLLPLGPTPFNRMKSDLKFLEHAGHGVTALASPTVYEGSIIDGQTGLLFRDANEFETKLRALIEDVPLRRRLATAAYAWAKNERLLSQHYRERYTWYVDMRRVLPQLNTDLKRRAPELFAPDANETSVVAVGQSVSPSVASGRRSAATLTELLTAAALHYQSGRRDLAIECLRQALRLQPSVPEVHNNLGITLAQDGQLAEAEASFRTAVRLKPDYADAHNNLGNTLRQQGRLAEAQDHLLEAVRLRSHHGEAHHNLGLVYLAGGDLAGAASSLQDAVRLKPNDAEIHLNLGSVFMAQEKWADAVASYRQAVACKPDCATAHHNLANALGQQGHLTETVASLQQALRLRPDYAEAHSRLILTFHYLPGYDAGVIYEECRRWNEVHAEPLRHLIQPHGNQPDPERRLRIGYVSPVFGNHASCFFTIPLLSSHDHRHFEIFCYSDTTRPDATTERHRGYADVWRSTEGLTDQQVADMVRSDRIDILVDLAMHTSNNRLLAFARKPAPVQVSWLAYPGTTGLSTMDYRLTDPYLDPPGLFDAHYAEESVRLPQTYWCYDPLTDQPAVNALPARERGVITFGCLNHFCKVNDDCLALWARVLQAVPQSRLLLLAPRVARERVLARLGEAGVEALRVEFTHVLPRLEYLRLYHQIDLCLDPLPCNGHTTSLDAFWMGVPTITLVSRKTAFGRAGWSQLCNLGLKDLAAETPEEYVAAAARLVGDMPRLEELRGALRLRMRQSPLMDGRRFARHMEQAYRQMWRTWCQKSRQAESSQTEGSEPGDAEAHLNFGNVLLQQGKRGEAEASYRQAVRCRPNSADAHNNLGVALFQQGKLEEAATALRTALQLKPDFAEAHHNLGLTLQAQGKTSEAVACLQQSLSLKPDYAEAHVNLGNALQDQGRLEDAEANYRHAIQIRANYAEAYNNLGTVLRKRGLAEEAMASFQQALRIQPRYADAHENIGNLLRSQGRLNDAVAAFVRVLELNPHAVHIHSRILSLCDALTRQGYVSEAEGHLREAIRLRPDLPEGHYNLAFVLQEQRQLTQAEASLRHALLLKPDSADAHNSLGQVLREQNRLEEAGASFQQALRLNARDAAAHCNLGALREDLGDLDAAARCYREALRHEPEHTGALAGLATMLRGKLAEPELPRIQEQLANRQLGESQRRRLLYALAQVLDARGEYDKAAAHLEEANALELARWRRRGRGYDTAEFSRFVDRLQQTFSRAFFDKVRGWGLASERPVFVFGLPRSGTTLTEQILASHSQVYGGGELSFAENSFQALAELAPALLSMPGMLEETASPRAAQLEQVFAALDRLDDAGVDWLAEQHLRWLATVNPSRARVTSKTPGDWQFVGLLAALFPRARFIHCRRDLRDTALSCWMTHFRLLNWTCDHDHIAAQFHDYQRLMAHWRSCLPVPILEVDYEQTVADLEGTARRLVDWLGLEWEAACLNFHKTRRPIRTASVAQVRQPIFHSSLGRWRHYASALGSLFAQL
jgi:predicted O-linked N-acetylglucosamine transferase (SPINDLY family)